MFYHLLAPLGKQYIIFNLFNYISFRAAGATVTALLLAFVVGPADHPPAARAQGGPGDPGGGPGEPPGQARHAHDGRAHHPARHRSCRRCSGRRSPTASCVVAMLSTLWMGCIGFLDDYLKIVQGKSRGLVAKWKLVGQVQLRAAARAAALTFNPVVPADTIPATATTLPFFKYLVVNFAPWLFVVFVTVVITGSQQRGEPDRRPGRAGHRARRRSPRRRSPSSPTSSAGWTPPPTSTSSTCPGAGELAVFCAALMGATIGFLWFNAHPAQVFMGDTGSLAIGGALGTVAILLKAEFLLLLIGGVFAAEAMSVMLQTGTYKWFKRTRGKEYADAHRVFRMAPLHHHFEKLGWAETTVVTRFYILGLFCALRGPRRR